MAIDVGECELHGFDLQVQAFDGIRGGATEIEMFQDTERDQRRDALAIGRNFMHAITAISLADRFDPVRLVRGQIIEIQCTPACGTESGDALREGAAIERFSAGARDFRQGVGLFGKPEQFADTRGAATAHEGLREAGLILQARDLRFPLRGDNRRNRKSVACIVDGRLE